VEGGGRGREGAAEEADPCSDAEAGGLGRRGDGERPLPVAPPWVCPVLSAAAAEGASGELGSRCAMEGTLTLLRPKVEWAGEGPVPLLVVVQPMGALGAPRHTQPLANWCPKAAQWVSPSAGETGHQGSRRALDGHSTSWEPTSQHADDWGASIRFTDWSE